MKRSSDLLLRNIGGQNVLVPLGAKISELNGIIILNEMGRFIWEYLAENRSVDELVDAILNHFDVQPTRARSDVQVFVAKVTKWNGIEA